MFIKELVCPKLVSHMKSHDNKLSKIISAATHSKLVSIL